MTPDQTQIEVAKIAAKATVDAANIAATSAIEAANIASYAAHFTGISTLVASLIALTGALALAHVTRRNFRDPFNRDVKKQDAEIFTLRAVLTSQMPGAIERVEDALLDYRSDYSLPVELKVLHNPAERAGISPDKREMLAEDMIDAIIRVENKLKEYAAAKQPIQDKYGKTINGSSPPAILNEKPQGIDDVILKAEKFKDALEQLKRVCLPK